MDHKYFPVQEQLEHRSYGLIKISIAWLMGSAALWMYANEEPLLEKYIIAFGLYLVLTKLVGFFGWRDYARSKGYGWGFGFFSFVPFLGPAFLVFLEDRWQDQELPKIAIRKYTW